MKKTIKLSSRLEDLNKETQEKLLKLHKEKYVTMAKLCLIDFDIIITSVKDTDFTKLAKHQTNSSLYHLAGDSIVTTVLMGLFGTMLDLNYYNKIKEWGYE